MPIEITTALMALAGAGCGMLITIYVTSYTHIIAARHRFAAAFTDELVILKSGKFAKDCTTTHLLENAFDKHSRAYIELWSVLDRFGKWRIEKKWDTYKYGTGERRNKERFIYLVPVDESCNEAEMMKIAIKHIESLVQ